MSRNVTQSTIQLSHYCSLIEVQFLGGLQMDNPDTIPVCLADSWELCLLSTLMRKSGKTSSDTPPGDWDKTLNQHSDAAVACLCKVYQLWSGFALYCLAFQFCYTFTKSGLAYWMSKLCLCEKRIVAERCWRRKYWRRISLKWSDFGILRRSYAAKPMLGFPRCVKTGVIAMLVQRSYTGNAVYGSSLSAADVVLNERC